MIKGNIIKSILYCILKISTSLTIKSPNKLPSYNMMLKSKKFYPHFSHVSTYNTVSLHVEKKTSIEKNTLIKFNDK